MNYNNLAQKTNYSAGSAKLELAPFYLTNVNLPGINFGHPELTSRAGRFAVTGDTIVYNPLSFEMLIDEDFNIYHEFMDKVFKTVNSESGTFATQEFDFWVQINNSKGNKLFLIEFYNCRVESVGDIMMDAQDEMTEHTMTVDIKYDYFKVNKDDGTAPPLMPA
jgi:hypothetical protein